MEDPKKQIEIIEEMISAAKGNLSDGSIFYLIWGWLVFIAALSNYYLLNVASFANHWIVWPVLMGLGGIITMLVGIKKGRKEKNVSYIDKFLRSLWLGFIITMLVVLSGIGVDGPAAIYPCLMALYGLGTFVSGMLLKFKALQIGAVSSWVCASIAFYVDFSDQLLLIAVAILLSYIIPGHLLAAKNKGNA